MAATPGLNLNPTTFRSQIAKDHRFQPRSNRYEMPVE